MEITRENVLEVLGSILEPDLKKDLVSANLVEDLTVEGNKISLKVFVTNPAMHAKKRMQEAIDFNLKNKLGDDIEIEASVQGLPADAKKSQRKILPEVKNIVAISSGKGGVGKSTIAANLAVGLSDLGYKVGVIDADIYGPSMHIMFGLEGATPSTVNVDGKSKIKPLESYGVKLLSIGFFAQSQQAVVWRGPMAVKALKQLIFDADWGELDYLIIDTPPGTGDVHLSIVQSLPLTGAVVVTTPQSVALADAKKAIAMFKMDNINVPIIGLVENMSWFTPKNHPDEKYFIFGENGGENLSKSLDISLLGKIPLVQSIRQSGDAGRPAVLQQETVVEKYYDNLCDELMKNIDQRNANLEGTKVVEVEYGEPKCSK